MPTIIDLGQRLKAKYPGAYDDLSDGEVGRRLKARHPGAYDDFEDVNVPGIPGGLPPGPPKPPKPYELGGPKPAAPPEPISINARTGLPEHEVPMGSVPILDAPYTGAQKIAAGATEIAGAGSPPKDSTTGRRLAGGASKIIGGTLEAAQPVMAGTGIAAPLETATALALGTGAQEGTRAGLEAAGVDPEYAELGGQAAGLITGYKAAKAGPEGVAETAAKVGRGVRDAASDVATGAKGAAKGIKDNTGDILQAGAEGAGLGFAGGGPVGAATVAKLKAGAAAGRAAVEGATGAIRDARKLRRWNRGVEASKAARAAESDDTAGDTDQAPPPPRTPVWANSPAPPKPEAPVDLPPPANPPAGGVPYSRAPWLEPPPPPPPQLPSGRQVGTGAAKVDSTPPPAPQARTPVWADVPPPQPQPQPDVQPIASELPSGRKVGTGEPPRPETPPATADLRPEPSTPAQQAEGAAPTASAPPPPPEAQGIQPWQVAKKDLVQWKDTRPQAKYTPDESGGWSEAEMNARTIRNRNAETAPPAVPQPSPVGSWGLDSTGELMQLREYALDDPRLQFPEGLPNPNNPTVQKYLGWMQDGSEPPPLTAVETEKGNIKVQEGHHRAAAIKANGGNTVKAWTSITHNRPLENGAVMGEGVTHEQAVQRALAAGKPVPAEVLADYPDLQQKAPPPQPQLQTPAPPVNGAPPKPEGTSSGVNGAPAPPITANLLTDESGQPVTVYKGMPVKDWRTGKDISEIRSANGPWSGFFTSERPVAEMYAKAFGGSPEFPSKVVSANLRMERPYVVDAQGAPANKFQFDNLTAADRNPELLRAIQDPAYDGIIIKNTRDEGTIYVPKDPRQIVDLGAGQNGASAPLVNNAPPPPTGTTPPPAGPPKLDLTKAQLQQYQADIAESGFKNDPAAYPGNQAGISKDEMFKLNRRGQAPRSVRTFQSGNLEQFAADEGIPVDEAEQRLRDAGFLMKYPGNGKASQEEVGNPPRTN